MSFLTDALADTALKKLSAHMKKEGIRAYLATFDDNGEFNTKALNNDFVIMSKAEFQEMKQKYFEILHNTNGTK